MRSVALTFAALASVFSANFAYAFVDPPVLIPANPVAFQPISIAVTAGVCDLFGAAPPMISQTGNNIVIVLDSVHSFDNEYCTYPTYTSQFAVGAFDVGSYVLTVKRTYLGDNGTITETIGTLSFAITSVSAAPSLSLVCRLLLLCLILATALVALGRRHHKMFVLMALGIFDP